MVTKGVICVCVCVEISMSTANSPGLFTRLSEGSDTLARSLFSLFLSLSPARILLTSSSGCLTLSFFRSSPPPSARFFFFFSLLVLDLFPAGAPSAGEARAVEAGGRVGPEIRALEMLVAEGSRWTPT